MSTNRNSTRKRSSYGNSRYGKGGRRKQPRRYAKAKSPLTRRQRVMIQRTCIAAAAVLVVVLLILAAVRMFREKPEYTKEQLASMEAFLEPDFQVDLLDINEFSRPGIASDPINGIVIHYTANPGSTAKDNRDYFNNLQTTQITKASSHFVIGLEGEVIQCVPTNEIAYASNDRNGDTVSIECCHPDETGAFTDATYESMVQTTAWLCAKFGLSADDVIRHYDVTGKDCPKYFVEHEDAWERFRADVHDKLVFAASEVTKEKVKETRGD